MVDITRQTSTQKFICNFVSNLNSQQTYRQIDRQTDRETHTGSFGPWHYHHHQWDIKQTQSTKHEVTPRTKTASFKAEAKQTDKLNIISRTLSNLKADY